MESREGWIRSLVGLTAGMGIALALALVPASASADPDSFTGTCDITATLVSSSGETLEERHVSLRGEGTCSGTLNGEQVSNAPVRVRAAGSLVTAETDAASPPLPASAALLGSGSGRFTFVDEGATIGFTYQQAGPVRLLRGSDGGGAVAVLQPFTEEQPHHGSRVALRGFAVSANISG
jgi:hypothetical protein